ncbi:hypothetical protein EOD42_20025 [Rhodovarius crocodyli]|uniref:protein O-GlcNAc transferase n=1 Tax=Rhodovarius crocodyli TaxID=1979269 RepID=A0A437M393_9PROT|nr:tetratricopeptide repeat protein [Rhodovarius crocodyli]RVT92025.1 hypothetical protein EOD42_20025 [Rhodovarius crocodyli]
MNHIPPFRRAIQALAEGQTRAALPWLRQSIAEADEPELARLNLGMALADLGEFGEAEPLLRRALHDMPRLAEPRFRLGRIAAQRLQLTEARECFEAALATDPGHVMSLVGLAMLDEAAGRPEAALALLDHAALLAPSDRAIALFRLRCRAATEPAHAGMEIALSLLASPEGSVEDARLAASLLPPAEALPKLEAGAANQPLNWRWSFAIALVQQAAGEDEAAVASLRLAHLVSDGLPAVQGELGMRLAGLRRHAEAEPHLAQATHFLPSDPSFRSQHGITLFKLHRFSESRAVLEAAVRDFGPLPTLLGNLALTLNAQGLQREALATARRTPENVAGLANRLGVQPYHPQEGTAAALAATARALGALLPAPSLACHPPGFDPHRRLRVGFLSSSFSRHPVGWLTLAGIEALPREEVEVACFSLRPGSDALAQRFHARADLWRELPKLDDLALVEAIRADRPDILVDLGGHGEGGRVTALAHRAAPVQVKWVGAQSCTTGVPGLDWMLTDRWETPPGSEAHYTERLLAMPDGYVCYTPPAAAPPVAPLPASTRGQVTFGCFNNMAKMTPEVLTAWAEIMAATPGSRLVLRTHALADAATRHLVLERAVACGLDPARIEAHGPVPHEALLAAYGEIDIALEPFPYAGGLTACEALYMGVPLVALAGSSFAGRHAVSHLSNIGLTDWITESVPAYVRRAIAAAQDVVGLQDLRSGLRARMVASPLMDAPRFGRNLAVALRHAWHERCLAQ